MKQRFALVIIFSIITLTACSGSLDEGIPIPATASERPPEELFTLNLIANPASGGQVLPGDGDYSNNSKVILNAIPGKGYVFDNWSGSYSGTGNSLEIIMDSDKVITANFSQLPTATPAPTLTPTPLPCRKPADVKPDDANTIIEVCGLVTNWGAVPCPTCPLGGYSFLKLDGEFLIISYDWVFGNDWLDSCLLVADTVEMLGAAPVFTFGVSEGFAGSDCEIQPDGNRSCTSGDYFQMYFECDGDE